MQKRTLFIIVFFHHISLIATVDSDQKNARSRIRAELLYWTIRKNNTAVPFVTSAVLTDPLPGALGQPGTEVQLSSCDIPPRNHLGFRVSADVSIGRCNLFDLEASYVLLPKFCNKRELTTSGEPGSPNFAVPVFDTTGVWGLNGIPGETIAALPGPLFGEPGFFGDFNLCGATTFQGAELHALWCICERSRYACAASGGFGWMQFFESLAFVGRTHTDPDSPEPPDFFNFTDRFKTKNNFYGVLGGLRAEYVCLLCIESASNRYGRHRCYAKHS